MAVVDSYTTGDDSQRSVYQANWEGQSFTASQDYDISSVEIKVYKSGSPSGDLTVSIRATDGSGLPTGGDLASGAIACSSITDTSAPGDWYEITFGAAYSLSSGTKYAIVVRATSANSSNRIFLRADSSSPSYGGGNLVISSNAGTSWSNASTWDVVFKTYESDVEYVELSGTIAAESVVEDADLEIDTYISLSGTIAAVSEVENASLGFTAVSLGESVATKRVVAVGNNQLWYEDI